MECRRHIGSNLSAISLGCARRGMTAINHVVIAQVFALPSSREIEVLVVPIPTASDPSGACRCQFSMYSRKLDHGRSRSPAMTE
jgi:hypothetical protein